MDYLLHIGAHRTGTTATQKLFQGESALLTAAGIGFWGPAFLRGWGLYDVLQGMIDGRATDERVEGAVQVLKDYVAEAGTARKIVISDENLLGTMGKNYADATLYPDAEARLHALSRLLPAAPKAIIITIRDPVGYWQSVFAHLLARKKADQFDAERLASSPGNSWLPALQSLRKVFPHSRLKILHYDETVIDRLLADLVGPDLAERLPAARRALSLALPEWTRAELAGMRRGPERDEVSLRLRAARDQADHGFGAEQAATLDAIYAQDWALLRSDAVAGAVLDAPGTEHPT